MDQRQKYLDNLLIITKGGKGLPTNKGDKNRAVNNDSIDISSNSKNIMRLREEVENRDKYTVVESNEVVSGKKAVEYNYFFKPLSGLISKRYKPNEKHFGIDIVAVEGSPVKSALDGTVIFSGFVISYGYTVIIQHENEFISVYKHNKEILKSVGSIVKS